MTDLNDVWGDASIPMASGINIVYLSDCLLPMRTGIGDAKYGADSFVDGAECVDVSSIIL